MNITEIRKKEAAELEKLIAENRQKVVDLKFKIVNSETVNSAEIKNTKKTVARLLTVQNEKRNENE